METIHHLSVDIESYSDVDLTKAGLFKYAQSPAFAILLFAYSLDGGPVEVIDLTQPGATIPRPLVNALLDPDTIKHAYNAAFEWYCISRHFGWGDPWTAEWASQWRCTMLHGQYCGFPGRLADVGPAMGLPADKQKDSVGKSLITYFCKPCEPTKTNGRRTRNLPHHDPDKWNLFIEYNRQDVVAEMEIERRLSGFQVPEDVQRQWVLDQRINLRGVAVDLDLVDAALAMDAVNSDMLVREAQQISGLENPNSVAQLKKWLEKELDEEVADLRKETVTDLLGRDIPNEDALRMLEIRRDLGKASNKKYVAMKTAAGEDGRLRGMMQFYGANRTGREAGRIVQPQNLPHDTVDHEDLARELVKTRNRMVVQFAYGSVPHTLSALIRTALVAGPGCTFVDADFSAIEARVIAWLAGEEWVLEVFRTHGKIYEATASQMFGIPMELIKKGNPEYAYRAKGKVATLALGYQGGSNALINMGALRSGIPEEELPEIVERWRSSNPAIKNFWYKVEAAAQQAVNTGRRTMVPLTGGQVLVFAREMDPANGLDFMTIALPSGRKLFYANPHMGQNRFGSPSLCYWGQNGTSKKWAVTETYGGKLAENCLAGDTLVLTDRGLVRIRDIRPEYQIWDGEDWVRHGGIKYQGAWPTITVDGLRMTPDHQILTTKGWVRSSGADGLNWRPVRPPDHLEDQPERPRREAPVSVGTSGQAEPVYDIRDCGPRNRFCVYDPETNKLRLVHNCTQAVARDCLFYAMENLTEAGYRVVFDVHDEVVLEVPEDRADLEDVVRIMSRTPPWAPGLPLNADGWVNPFFHKD